MEKSENNQPGKIGIDTCPYIIGHYSQTALDPAIYDPYGPGLPDIEKTKKEKAGKNGWKGDRMSHHGDQVATDFIDYDLTGVGSVQFTLGFVGYEYPESEQEGANIELGRRRKMPDGEKTGHTGNQRGNRAGAKRGSSDPENRC